MANMKGIIPKVVPAQKYLGVVVKYDGERVGEIIQVDTIPGDDKHLEATIKIDVGKLAATYKMFQEHSMLEVELGASVAAFKPEDAAEPQE